MASIVVTPRPEIFSQVPEFDSVLMQFREKGAVKLIENVGKIFVKYDVCDRFGLCMAHRHFEMAENEVLVETVKRDKTVSVFSPWKILSGGQAEPVDMSILTRYGVEIPKGLFLLPQNWVFDPSGEAIAFEYLAAEEKGLLSQPPTEFVRELHAALMELGVERLIGLRSIEAQGRVNSWENTPENMQASVVVYGKKPKELESEMMVKVLWTFDKAGKIQDGGAMCLHCVGHCYDYTISVS